MTREDLELMRRDIFDKETVVNGLIVDIKTIKGERFALVQRLRKECPHEEVSHCAGYVCKEVKLAEIDMPGHFEYEEVDVVAPRRKCVCCGLNEVGKHVLSYDALKKKYDNLPVGQSVDIDFEYIFKELGNQEKRKVTKFLHGTHVRCPEDYF